MYTYLIRRIIYAINKFNKSVISRVTLSKTKLFVKKKVIIVQVIIYSDVHYPRQNFRETQKYGNWPIVCQQFCLDLKIGVTFAIFIFSGKIPRFVDFLKIFSGGFFMSSYTDLIIFTCKPSWPGASLLLSDLNTSSNSSLHTTVSFNVVFMLEDTV